VPDGSHHDRRAAARLRDAITNSDDDGMKGVNGWKSTGLANKAEDIEKNGRLSMGIGCGMENFSLVTAADGS
jgi:hypothetical protein